MTEQDHFYRGDGAPVPPATLERVVDRDGRLQRAAQHLAAIVESSDDAIISKDLNGIIQTWNKAAERMFGYRAEEIVGKSVLTLIPAERHSEEDLILGRIRSGLPIEHFETVRRCKDGSLINISLTVSPVKDNQGRVIGASKIARDIRERKQAEASKELLLREIKHRVKNMLASVHAIAAQSFKNATPAEREIFTGRLQALARAHDLLTRQDWQSASVAQLAELALVPFTDGRKQRIVTSGAPILLSPNKALLVSMLLHELATNAVKYGALSNDSGTIGLRWNNDDDVDRLTLEWQEAGGPPVSPPGRRGFGTRMIERAHQGEKGSALFDFQASGLVCRMQLPL